MKQILLVTKDTRTHEVFKKQLNDFFGEEVRVLDALTKSETEQADLILTSYLPLVPLELQCTKNIVLARRTMDFSRLEPMVQVPADETCFVVNNTLESSMETISLLKNLGYDFTMVPYYPGAPIPTRGITIALAPDEASAPPGVEHVIPIGFRPLDISTLIELGVKLGVTMDQAHLHTAKASQEIVRLSRRIAGTLVDVRQLHEELHSVLNVNVQSTEKELKRELKVTGFAPHYQIADIVGESRELEETVRMVRKVAGTDFSVVLHGETGTGKEIFAHAIHTLSPRCNGPFIPINFAGLPESLAESELFGYEEGTFTGGKRGGKPGLFELSHQGTIFLDEIGDASLECQALLLRVLQENQVMRVGGRRLIPVDVRVIAATNRDLAELVRLGKFREDLYYRLSVFPIHIPPLRERQQDLPLLVRHFTRRNGQLEFKWSEEVMEAFQTYHWPGNIRELRSVVQYATTVADGPVIQFEDLPPQFHRSRTIEVEPDVIEALTAHGELRVYTDILELLSEAQREKDLGAMGRAALSSMLKDKGLRVSEQQVRYRLGVLEDLELVNVGRKRQGTSITERGERLLRSIRHLGLTPQVF